MVGGVAPVPTTTLDFTTHPGNPQITVTMQRTDVPTFFARIFGQRLATVSATAIAEAYNSSNTTGASGSMPPVAPTCTKPWLVANLDPDHPVGASFAPFVNTDGSLAHPGVWSGGGGGIIAEPITLPNIWQSPLPSPSSLPATCRRTSPTRRLVPAHPVRGEVAILRKVWLVATPRTPLSIAAVRTPRPSRLTPIAIVAGSLAGAACLLTGAGGSGPTPGGNDFLDPSNFQTQRWGRSHADSIRNPASLRSGRDHEWADRNFADHRHQRRRPNRECCRIHAGLCSEYE